MLSAAQAEGLVGFSGMNQRHVPHLKYKCLPLNHQLIAAFQAIEQLKGLMDMGLGHNPFSLTRLDKAFA